jgi:subtilase family serine protease
MATSSPPLTVASCSLGFGYSDNSNQALGEMAVTGVTFFTASGDSGDIGNNDPGNLKFVNQTLVGGTFLSTNTLTAPLPNPVYPSPYYAGENTWTGSGFATGGGILNGVNIPDYQVGVSMATNGGSTQFRNYPDVAMVASNVEFFFNGAASPIGGTSASAPLWAGFMALVNQFNQQNGGAGKAGFINPTIYDLGLTRGTADDLYKVCFNDITDNGNNGVGGGGSGFNAVAGYDLCTGWGSPQAGLINQLGSVTPLTPNQPLSLIRFIITTGNDDAGGGLHGSTQTADCFVPGGGVFTLTLRNSGDANWGNGSTHEVDFPIPATDDNSNPVPTLTQSKGLTGVRINLEQHNPDWSADNWDIANLQVSLFNPGSPQVCQLNLVGTSILQDGSTGLVRLSKNADSSGNGPSSPIYSTGPGSGC